GRPARLCGERRDGALRLGDGSRQLAAWRDHHQEPRVPGMVVARAAADHLLAARRRIRVPLRSPSARPAHAPHRSHLGELKPMMRSVDTFSRVLGLLPPPAEPRPAGVRPFLILPEAGKPAAGWGRGGEGGGCFSIRRLASTPTPNPSPQGGGEPTEPAARL